jgi:hypothetical protein
MMDSNYGGQEEVRALSLKVVAETIAAVSGTKNTVPIGIPSFGTNPCTFLIIPSDGRGGKASAAGGAAAANERAELDVQLGEVAPC